MTGPAHDQGREALPDRAHGGTVLGEVNSVGAHGRRQVAPCPYGQEVTMGLGQGSELLKPLETFSIAGGARGVHGIAIPDPESSRGRDRGEAGDETQAAS